jgi:hypothetical protein
VYQVLLANKVRLGLLEFLVLLASRVRQEFKVEQEFKVVLEPKVEQVFRAIREPRA